MADIHDNCGCLACRIALVRGLGGILELTPEQYLHVISTGELEATE